MLLRACCVAFGFALIAGSQSLPPELRQLVAMKRETSSRLNQIPNYTCIETVNRTERAHPGTAPDSDTLRVEVAVVDGKEVYAWPGRTRFSSLDLSSMIGYGFTSTGLFAGFAHNLFVDGNGTLHYAGPSGLRGQPSARYDFVVPELADDWRINWMGSEGQLGERGSFWVDAKTLVLRRLEVDATDIPPGIPVREIHLEVDYDAATLAGRNVLIPSSALVHAAEWSGKTLDSRMFFSHCREFTAISTLSAGAPAPEEQIQTQMTQRTSALPPGLTVTMTLNAPIDSDSAVVGDPIKATVARDVRSKRSVLIPAGAVLEGHVRKFDRLNGSGLYLVALEFDEVQTAAGRAQFFAKLVSMAEFPGFRQVLVRSKYKKEFLADGGSLSTLSEERLWPGEIPGVGAFFIEGVHALVPAGCSMAWKTESLETSPHRRAAPRGVPEDIPPGPLP